MNLYSRRKFLKSALLTVGGLAVSSHLGKIKASPFEQSSSKYDLLKKARLSFYKKEYQNAEFLYLKVISEYPDEISGYDGIAKIHNVRQDKLAVVRLYEKGLNNNSHRPVFYDRLARALGALSLGDRKQENNYIFEKQLNISLIEQASILYIEALALAPTKKYLYEGLLDTTQWMEKKNFQLQKFNQQTFTFSEKILQQIDSVIPKLNKIIWEESRKKQKNKGKETHNLSLALEKMKYKSRRELYFKKEIEERENALVKKRKEFIYPFFLAAIANDNKEKAKEYFKKIKSIDEKEINSFFQLSRYYKKKKYYTDLYELYEQENIHSAPYWKKIGQAQILSLMEKEENNSSKQKQIFQLLKEAHEYIEENGIKEDNKALTAIYSGMGSFYLNKSNYQQSRSVLQEGMGKIAEASGFSTTLIINYAKTFEKEGKYGIAEKILLRLSEEDPNTVISEDAFMNTYLIEREQEIKWMKKHKMGRWRRKRGKKSKYIGTESASEKLKASYSLANLYEKRNTSSRHKEVLDYIEKEDPENKFARKRRNKKGNAQ